jgi:hypothetical protein
MLGNHARCRLARAGTAKPPLRSRLCWDASRAGKPLALGELVVPKVAALGTPTTGG